MASQSGSRGPRQAPTQTDDDNVDWLTSDPPIYDQRYALVSLVLPESMTVKRELFLMTEFLKKTCADLNQRMELQPGKPLKVDADRLAEEYTGFKEVQGKKLGQEFAEANGNATSVMGLKIRAVFESEGHARKRTKHFQEMDPACNVFLAEVGKWLPMYPSMEAHIENEEFANEQLNDMMKKYKENLRMKDELYQQDKRERVQQAHQDGQKQRPTVKDVQQQIESADHFANKKSFQQAVGEAGDSGQGSSGSADASN